MSSFSAPSLVYGLSVVKRTDHVEGHCSPYYYYYYSLLLYFFSRSDLFFLSACVDCGPCVSRGDIAFNTCFIPGRSFASRVHLATQTAPPRLRTPPPLPHPHLGPPRPLRQAELTGYALLQYPSGAKTRLSPVPER